MPGISCSSYAPRLSISVNNVTGSNLIECDQVVLKEMGIKKIGDRVRIFVAIKQLRTRALGAQRKRTRDSIAALDSRSTPYTPSSSGSPRHNTARERLPTPSTGTTASNRYSRQFDPTAFESFRANENKARPSSPLAEPDQRGLRAQRYGGMSPVDGPGKAPSQGYFSHPSSAKTPSGRRPGTPSRPNMGTDSTVGKLPPNSPVIRIIWNNGQTKVLDIKNCNTAEEIFHNVLKKLALQERYSTKNYCFYTLDASDHGGAICRRLNDNELVRICKDHEGNDRNRLILRKIHEGPPEADDLRKATAIYNEEHNEAQANNPTNSGVGNKVKVAQRLGEPWENVDYPPSPGPGQYSRTAGQTSDRNRSSNGNQGWDLPEQPGATPRVPKPKIKEFLGGRPPSELINQELTTYFPDHEKDAIERAVRMSIRRSARFSRAASRVSVASNVSFTSNLKDAPPLPNIAHAWLAEGGQPRAPRPLSVSVSRFALPQMAYRDSVASNSLQPLAEESPLEPNRKSYVSFDSDPNFNNNDAGDSGGASSALQSYFDESGSSGPTTEAGGSFTDQVSHALRDDGEEPDPELDSFLKGESWDNVKWMQGALIGQGSFGSVYLALHAVTGELMAVKQVEVPSNSNSTLDKKKSNMVAALKREIDLLRDLQHENIVRYLGSNSDEEHFNIFLEYVPGGSVAAMLNSYGQLHEPLIRNFVRQILAGLSYLHGRDIIHRDIKGANVLVDNKGSIKISDFGISKRVQASALLQPAGQHPHRPSLQGSVFWMAPEVVRQKPHTRKADIWSLGCLVVEMFTGTHPYPDCSQLQAIFQIGSSNARPKTPDNASPEGVGFLDRTFEIDEKMRPSADELLGSPFLKQIA